MDKLTALDAVLHSGIIVASDTAEFNRIAIYSPTDATSNPSLVLAAVRKPEYSHLINEAVAFAQSRHKSVALDQQTDSAMDYLLVQIGKAILHLIPGRVSISVDPRLAFDYDAIVSKGRVIVALFEELGISRRRVLIKIPATYPGILAARTLESGIEPIHTNITLIFGCVQALACAQAGASVISPFVGRVKDWWVGNTPHTNAIVQSPAEDISTHPGLLLVRDIRRMYTREGYSHRTQIMAAGFRHVEEIIELGKYGSENGPDLVTLPPEHLDDLIRRTAEVISRSHVDADDKSETPGALRPLYTANTSTLDEDAYQAALAAERIALDKVPEGLAKFAADVEILEAIIREKLSSAIVSEGAIEARL